MALWKSPRLCYGDSYCDCNQGSPKASTRAIRSALIVFVQKGNLLLMKELTKALRSGGSLEPVQLAVRYGQFAFIQWVLKYQDAVGAADTPCPLVSVLHVRQNEQNTKCPNVV